MKEVYWEIKINKPGPRFLPELSLSGPAKVVYFDLPIYFLHVFTQIKHINMNFTIGATKNIELLIHN